jgi:hypothetical protein
MRKVLIVSLVILLLPVFIVIFVVVHEVGHTILARLLGDPQSVFYLYKFDEQSTCLGCNIYDPYKLSWGGNLLVSLGGLAATQLSALVLLFLRRGTHHHLWSRVFGTLGLAFAFLDVPVQVVQGLLYNLDTHTWPTNTDLTDFMLLIQGRVGGSQLLLKGTLLAPAVIYLAGVLRLHQQNGPAPEPLAATGTVGS